MIREFIQNCTLATQVALTISCLLWLWKFRSLPREIKRLGPFLFITLFVQFYSVYLSRQGLPNLYLLHIYTFLELLSLAYFYSYLLKDQPAAQKAIPLLTGTVSVLIIANTIFLEPITGFNSNAKSLVQISLIGAAIYYFFIAFGKVDLARPLPRALILVNFAVMLYYSSTLFIFMSSRFLNDNHLAPSLHNLFWAINALIYVIFVLLIFVSLWTVAFRKTR